MRKAKEGQGRGLSEENKGVSSMVKKRTEIKKEAKCRLPKAS